MHRSTARRKAGSISLAGQGRIVRLVPKSRRLDFPRHNFRACSTAAELHGVLPFRLVPPFEQKTKRGRKAQSGSSQLNWKPGDAAASSRTRRPQNSLLSDRGFGA